MNDFPFFQHHVVKIIFKESVDVDEELIDETATLIINVFDLKVVDQGRHEFANNGFTKFWVLSQSHLVIHSWPENNALHIDLMTCIFPKITSKVIRESLRLFSIKDIVIVTLDY